MQTINIDASNKPQAAASSLPPLVENIVDLVKKAVSSAPSESMSSNSGGRSDTRTEPYR
jgi:hypothetical protein